MDTTPHDDDTDRPSASDGAGTWAESPEAAETAETAETIETTEAAGAPPSAAPTPGIAASSPTGSASPHASEPRAARRSWLAVGAVAALIGAVVGGVSGGLVGAALSDHDGEATPASRRAASDAVPAITDPGDVRQIVERVGPAVVAIDTRSVSIDGLVSPFQDGAGSGFIVDEAGVIITNNHVIAGATNITVTVADGRELAATVLGRDPTTDLAVLDVDANDLPTVAIGDSDALQVGDPVVAIGNALGLGDSPTVTTGIVSALDRSISAGPGTTLRDLIQTDAAINPGNSGGPLVNAKGQVVGVNTAIAGGAENIGFALAISSFEDTLKQLESGEMPRQPFLGVQSRTVDDQVKERLDLEVDEGALVLDVTPGSGAELAGISRGDVVLKIGDVDIASAEDLAEAVQDLDPGEEVAVRLHRAGEERTVTVTIGERSGSLG